MTERHKPLHVRIERRIRELPFYTKDNRVVPLLLGGLLDFEILQRIAIEASKEAQDYYHEQSVRAAANRTT